MKLAYGLSVASVLIAGGVAFFYRSWPGASPSALEPVELKEAYNERLAARALAFSGSAESGWSFQAFATQSMILTHADLSQLMSGSAAMAPYFVDWHDGTNYAMLTTTGQFARLGIGDRSNQFTVGYAGDGSPIYSNTPFANFPTTLLWEVHRLLASYTSTLHAASRSWATNETGGETFGNTYGGNDMPDPLTWAINSFEPDGDPNGDAIVARMNYFDLSTNFNLYPGVGGFTWAHEEWDMDCLLASTFERLSDSEGGTVLWRTNVVNSGHFTNQYRRLMERSQVRYVLPMSGFASGVVASVTWAIPVSVDWTTFRTGVVDSTTKLSSYTGFSFSVSFPGPVATNYMVSTADVAVSVADWIPEEAQSVTHPLLFEQYTNSTAGGWDETWTWRGRYTYSSPFFTMGGEVRTFTPLVFVDWVFSRCRPPP